MELYQFVTISEISKKTNIKPESNILSTKIFQLHKNILRTNETTEHSRVFINM